MSITQVTLTQVYSDPNPSGSTPTGVVRIDLGITLTDTSTGAQVPPRTILADVIAGVMTPQVVDATDDPTTTPVGVQYHFTEMIDGAPSREWSAPVPHTAPGGTATLASLYAPP